jgi:hypothetical protein
MHDADNFVIVGLGKALEGGLFDNVTEVWSGTLAMLD